MGLSKSFLVRCVLLLVQLHVVSELCSLNEKGISLIKFQFERLWKENERYLSVRCEENIFLVKVIGPGVSLHGATSKRYSIEIWRDFGLHLHQSETCF
jgi:hypothetical protein